VTHFYKITVLIIAVLFQFFLFTSSSNADEMVGCNNFTATPLVAPKPQTRSEARDRLALVNAAIKKGGEQILFFGDSLVEKWSAERWDSSFGNRGTINAGINGDRTYNLLWRLAHGSSLDGPPVPIIIVLIGTNDLGDSSTPEATADSIRQVLLFLRTKTPQTKLLLLGLLPRTDRFGQKIAEVNRLIKTCVNPLAVLSIRP
jgi:lysophospholipase L1-like esterase